MRNMMNPFAKVASVIFGMIAMLHLLRLTFFHLEVVVGNFHVPMWISMAGFVVTGALCLGLWKEAGKGK